MPLILNIDTATEYAGVCLSRDGKLVAKREHELQHEHAAFLQPAIQEIMQETGITLSSIDAVAVTGGPGSYTGIRVGLASAKGICFALNKPLIILNTLAVIAQAALEEWQKLNPFNKEPLILYPMIDARRMEVFCVKYNQKLWALEESEALILSDAFFAGLGDQEKIIFCGSGAAKMGAFILPDNCTIIGSQHAVNHMITKSEQAFKVANFAHLAYSEPLYVKEFYQKTK
ncbi:MAG: tRNA (adenosine(37)-N6)-threonylcarbamoyltransferase complex dimerization subunit type 1 TsaB [Sphingobacteriia bacterium]|nr:MAG: tRNA (adenosine(37)-N6)-threonylcarbamoyltransferase complex dimerization subunit type 1 TsaB [Sphingobacteriia bacterium]